MDLKNIILSLAVIGIIALSAKEKQKLLLPFVLALCMSLIWTSYYRYEYVGANIFVLDRINIYPLVLWTVGLTALAQIYTSLKKNHSFLTTLLVYYLFLAAFETVGYHTLNIHLTSNYTSLLDLGIIHAPRIMKIFYILAGPLYLLLIRSVISKPTGGGR